MRTYILCAILLAASVVAVPPSDGEDGAAGSNVASTSNEASGTGENAEAGPSDQSRRLFRIGNAEEKEKGEIKLRKQDWHWTDEPLASDIRPANPGEPVKGLSTFDSAEQAKKALVDNVISNLGKDKKEKESKAGEEGEQETSTGPLRTKREERVSTSFWMALMSRAVEGGTKADGHNTIAVTEVNMQEELKEKIGNILEYCKRDGPSQGMTRLRILCELLVT